MEYDLFISYSRKDNETGRITELVDYIRTDFESFSGNPLVPFFDRTEIHGMCMSSNGFRQTYLELRDGFRTHINLSCNFSKSKRMFLLPS
jgi:hypothetical protein